MGYAIIFCAILLFSVIIPNVEALTPACPIPENVDQIRQDYINLSNLLIWDWKIERVHVGCSGSIQTFYILPKFSSENTTFVVLVNPDHDLRDIGETVADFLINRNQVVENSISKLKSNEVFKEIDSKLVNKRIAFLYGTDIFGVTAYNESEYYVSTFTINTQRNDLFDFRLIHNVKLESLPLIDEMHKHAENFLVNSSSFCKIEHCFEDLCGNTSVYTGKRFDSSGKNPTPVYYTARIDLEGQSCPPHIKVGLKSDWKLRYVLPINEKWADTELPPALDSPLKQVLKGILSSDVKCNAGLELMIKSSDGSPACVKPKTALKLKERGWQFPSKDIKKESNLLTSCDNIFDDWKEAVQQFEESERQFVEFMPKFEKHYKKYVEEGCDLSRIHNYEYN